RQPCALSARRLRPSGIREPGTLDDQPLAGLIRWRSMVLDRSPVTICVLAVTVLYACASTPAESTSKSTAEPASGPQPASEAESAPVGVMANALHTPDPDMKALQNTAAARFHKSDGVAVIGFCVDVHGQTGDF